MKMSKIKYLSYCLLIFVMISFSTVSLPGAGTAGKVDPATVSLEEIYQVKPFSGRIAAGISFSKSDRYLAFTWNPVKEIDGLSMLNRFRGGRDLYVYDIKSGKLTRVTSLEKMKRFDPPEDYEKFVEKRKELIEQENRKQEMFYAMRDFLQGKEVDLGKYEKEDIEKLKKTLEEEKKKKEEEKKKKEAEKKKEEEKKSKDKKDKSEKKDAQDKQDKKDKKDKKEGDCKKDEEKGKDKAEDKKEDKDAKGDKDKKDKKKEDKELELWELREKLEERKDKDKIKASDVYPGVRRYKWSEASDELIFNYRGDLYRYIPSSQKITRLTMSDENENIIRYTRDGKGYYYGKGSKVYRVMFNSSYVHQLNHKLDNEKKFKIMFTDISPDDIWMLIMASKENGKPKYRDVKMMSYKERWAKPVITKRHVTEDKLSTPTYRLILRKIRKNNYGKEPEHVFEMPGGDVWFEFSSVEWTKKGDQYAFMTWEREKGDLKIYTGKTASGKKPELLFEMKEDVGFKSFYDNNIKFTPDGKKLLAILNNKDGFRQTVVFDLKTKKKMELIKGKFESHPILGFTKDSKYAFIMSDKQSTAMTNVYKVSLNDGTMKPVGQKDGMHRSSKVSHSAKYLATNFGHWEARPELFLINTANGSSKKITDSHRKEWEKYNFIIPERFSFKNRHGEVIQGMIFKPKGWKPEDKRPCITYMYGGPVGSRHTVEIDNFSGLAYVFQMIMAAKHGFVTVDIDPHGQSGYGKKFHESNWENVGKAQVEDLEDLVKHMEKGFGVDTKRVGLHGWSFGGYQTLRTMFSSPETFACGIAVASVTEWENYNSWYSGSTIGKSVRGKATLKKYSLLPMAKNLKHPLLLVHGMLDDNVLFQDTIRVYRELLKYGKETIVEIFIDPDGDHGLGGLVPSKSVFKKFESYFLEKLGTVK